MRLDRPVPEQFAEYFKGLFVGREIIQSGAARDCSAPCLGYSFRSQQEVKGAVLSRFPTTATLALMAMLIFLAVGISTGVLAARTTEAPPSTGPSSGSARSSAPFPTTSSRCFSPCI